ncbi:DNA-directed RNA polymerase sigma-70 factor [Oxalicibacterium flavum]|uniref:DNA-directed RNA polymerase sigma-70 factor n=1 Tax=Oxalicibacterium flavum TaxID=179467 RepID=A0A8J2XXK5_9BURK|nr:sigma-70 family RNA polymerase sigma factor [Oxalicibacterium flavum]GGC02755.1 DNA-directed RNA polymerase sigma-70 factor [Oxalicibacterium flavum]
MVARYYRELLSFLSRTVKDRDAAADLAQESYARVLAAQQAGQAIHNPRALLYRTARNLVIDQHRRDATRAEIEDANADDIQDIEAGPAALQPDVLLASQQGVEAMIAAIEQLPPRCRETFILHKFDGLSYAEIAERMNISARTVEMQLKIAMDVCWRCFDALHGDGKPHRRKRNRK